MTPLRPRPKWRTAMCAVVAVLCVVMVGPVAAQTESIREKSRVPAANSSEVRKAQPAGSDHSKHNPAAKPPAGQVESGDLAVAPTTVTHLTLDGDALRTTVLLDVTGRGRLRAYGLDAPPRIVIEGDGLAFGPDLAGIRLSEHPLVADFRFGAVDGGVGRLVLDLKRPARATSLEHVSGVAALSIQVSGFAQTAADALTLDLAAASGPPPPITSFSTTTTPADRAPHRRPVIMIDPGHGGRDPGAVTDTGVYEKDVVLAVARHVQATLSRTTRYDVRMTRDGDVSVTLDRRLVTSRLAQADLFISLHADTFAGHAQAAQVRGGSVYILTDQATSRLAAALADKENAADLRLGPDVGPSTGDVAVDSFLTDLTMRETSVFATTFQRTLIGALKGAMQLSRDPARGAAFKVLKQAGTPSVLVELGYMSHAQDVAQMTSPHWQAGVAAAIVRAVDGYFAGRGSAVTAR